MNTKLITLYFLDEFLSVSGMGVALFLSAGRIDWWPAWAAIAVWLTWFTAMDIHLLRFNQELMAERLTPPKGSKGWDRSIMSILRLMQLVRYILAGLDLRFGWTGGFPLAAQIGGLTVCVLSSALSTWAMAANTFFSQIVRIQSDRGHTVASGGPYRFVRHPAYVGMILFELAISTLLASWWALAAGGLCAILLILRTALEDRTLQIELNGYMDYARQVRYRLFPGIW
ncbi:MAG: isoprenylcysteine carboxylmethyltransferase family protein [Anaerolineales bacterium]|jgi:protein-S-isoprenylcysteine O-methyltransferase Ste14